MYDKKKMRIIIILSWGDVRMVKLVKLSRISEGRQTSYLTKPFTLQKGDKGLKTVTVREAQDASLDVTNPC